MAKKNTGIHRLFLIGIIVLIVIWSGFNLINFLQYKKFYQFARQDLGENLALLSKSIASSIDYNWVELARIGMPELAEENPTELLNSLVDREEIYNISVLDTTGEIIYSTDSRLAVGIPNPYWASETKAIKTASLGIPTYGGLRKVEDRFLRVAFAPIYDPFGEVIGIMGLEAGANYFGLLATLHQGLWILGIVSTIAIIFIIVILWLGKRELEKLYSQLERAATLSGIGMMAATLAHEVKNPLAIIKSSAESIPDAPKNEVIELVDFINEEVERLAGIVESHLAVARGREFPKVPQKLSAVVEKVIPRYQKKLGKQGIGVIVEVESDPKVPYSFPSIRQVIYNIMENAASATQKGGIIRVKIGTENIKQNEYGYISISDTGTGIPTDKLEHIFEPFHTTKKQGTGLGLFIAKQIIEGHNGDILVESDESVGTTFKILIPGE
ncbi:hypothetical protein DRQ33_04435 [bacterium]|nr:MAG: hypothetical protein DRQ33_04435 [bacterium]